MDNISQSIHLLAPAEQALKDLLGVPKTYIHIADASDAGDQRPIHVQTLYDIDPSAQNTSTAEAIYSYNISTAPQHRQSAGDPAIWLPRLEAMRDQHILTLTPKKRPNSRSPEPYDCVVVNIPQGSLVAFVRVAKEMLQTTHATSHQQRSQTPQSAPVLGK